MVTTVFRFTALVVTLKLAEVSPASNVTVKGTVAKLVLLLDKFTTSPPAGAAAVRVTVPIDRNPPRILLGLRARFARAADGCGLTVNAVERVTPS